MPRGVPASGSRKPRRPTSLAAGPVDGTAGNDPTADVPPVAQPAVLIEMVHVDETPAGVDEPLGPTQPEEPKPTPEQQEIERLRHQVAQLAGKKDAEPEVEQLTAPGSSDNIRIHFLEDGLTALGQVWYRGQELEFEPGSRAYQDTFNRFGQSWLELAGNDFAQVDRWGKVMFRPGPWPGKNYVDGTFEPMRAEKDDARVGVPSQEELAAADKKRQTQRSAPRLPEQV